MLFHRCFEEPYSRWALQVFHLPSVVEDVVADILLVTLKLGMLKLRTERSAKCRLQQPRVLPTKYMDPCPTTEARMLIDSVLNQSLVYESTWMLLWCWSNYTDSHIYSYAVQQRIGAETGPVEWFVSRLKDTALREIRWALLFLASSLQKKDRKHSQRMCDV